MNTQTMNHRPPSQAHLFREMARKDWSLNRWPLLAYVVFGVLALSLLTMQSEALFHAGMIIIISSIVIVGAHLVFATVINEQANKTILFMLGLPLTLLGYTTGKLLFVYGYFLFAWLVLGAGIVALTLNLDTLPAGMLPYYTIVMGYLFLAFALTASVAIVMESHVWTIVVMSVCNICISIVMVAVGKVPGVGNVTLEPHADWNSTVLTILSLEALAIVGLIALTLLIQGRKTEYL